MDRVDGATPSGLATVQTWSRARRVGFLALVGLLVAGGPLGTDMYVPAMPEVSTDLETSIGLVQLTLPAYNVGLGAGQFFWGPASDRFGRRIPLIVGVAAFVLGCVLCAFAPSIGMLLAARVVMGFAGSAGVVIGRAIVRDLYEGRELTRIFGLLAIVFSISPIIAPLIGGVVLLFSDWRGTFFTIAGIGIVLLVCTIFGLPETLRPELRIRGRSPARREAWVAPLKNRVFVSATLILVGAASSMILYLSSVSIVLQGEHGLDSTAVAILFAVNAVGVIAGGQIGPLVSQRLGTRRTLVLALTLNLVAAGLVALASAIGAPLWLIVGGMWVTVFASGVCFPLALAMALEPFARGAGTAAAIAGGCQLALGSVIPAIVTNTFHTTGLVLGIAQAGASLLTLATVAGFALTARRTPR